MSNVKYRVPTSRLSWFSLPDWIGSLMLGTPVLRSLVFHPASGIGSMRRGDIVLDDRDLDGTPPEAAQPANPRAVKVFLPQRLFLKRRIVAPKAARRDLAQIAILDLRRRTPFEPSQVLALLSLPREAGSMLEVDQWVIETEDLDAVLQRLRMRGYLALRLAIDGVSDIAPIIIEWPERKRPGRRWRQVNAILLGAALLSGGSALSVTFMSATTRYQAAQDRVEELRAQAVTDRSALEAARSAEEGRSALLAPLLGPRVSTALHDLTVVLPDDVWVSDLIFRSGNLTVIGQTGRSAADLVLALTEEDVISDPRLVGGVSRSGDGVEQFEIEMRMRLAVESIPDAPIPTMTAPEAADR